MGAVAADVGDTSRAELAVITSPPVRPELELPQAVSAKTRTIRSRCTAPPFNGITRRTVPGIRPFCSVLDLPATPDNTLYFESPLTLGSRPLGANHRGGRWFESTAAHHQVNFAVSLFAQLCPFAMP